jgi:hypothetical protein
MKFAQPLYPWSRPPFGSIASILFRSSPRRGGLDQFIDRRQQYVAEAVSLLEKSCGRRHH